MAFQVNDASSLWTSQIVVDLLFTLQPHLKMKTCVCIFSALKISLNMLSNFISSNRMQFPYQIKMLFVCSILYYYGNFTVYQLEWRRLKWAGHFCELISPILQTSWFPFPFMLILFYANKATLFLFWFCFDAMKPDSWKEKQMFFKALGWTW